MEVKKVFKKLIDGEGSIGDEQVMVVSARTFNALTRHTGRATQTVHCSDTEPAMCAARLFEYIQASQENPRVALVGYQPAVAEKLSKALPLRILDLDEDNKGKEKFRNHHGSPGGNCGGHDGPVRMGTILSFRPLSLSLERRGHSSGEVRSKEKE